MTALSWTFMAQRGTAVHTANLTRSSERVMMALCGKPFDRPVTQASGRLATCDKCRKLDDPFHAGRVPFDSARWAEILNNKHSWDALLIRDLITTDGVITPRGILLSQDLTSPTPWADYLGITHTRLPAGKRYHGACGVDLLGIHPLAGASAINYDRLSKIRAIYEGAMVDCMTCVTLAARGP